MFQVSIKEIERSHFEMDECPACQAKDVDIVFAGRQVISINNVLSCMKCGARFNLDNRASGNEYRVVRIDDPTVASDELAVEEDDEISEDKE